MTQSLKLLLDLNNKQLARAAVIVTAAALGFACSSSSSSQPFNGDDATTGGDGGAEDVTAPSEPCDAAIVLPTGSAVGGTCGDCLTAQCASDLTLCQMTDCQCVTAIECLAVNNDLYTMCPDALSAIGAGNAGLTALAKCIVNSCPVCNEFPD